MKKGLFKRPENTLEGQSRSDRTPQPPAEPRVLCPRCKREIRQSELEDNLYTCPYCSQHMRMNSRRRVAMIADPGSFRETDAGISAVNIIGFPDYERKLETAKKRTGENDAVVCGECEIDGLRAMLFVMEPGFMAGSMGSAVGEKLVRTFEQAADLGLPVIGYAASGGARMQEGIISLMQMAKTSGAVRRHSDLGLLYVSVLTDPTYGGVTASFATEADIILAEPGAMIGFAGPRVIEQTIRGKLPDGFQRAEFLLEHGFVDSIADRKGQRKLIGQLLAMHRR